MSRSQWLCEIDERAMARTPERILRSSSTHVNVTPSSNMSFPMPLMFWISSVLLADIGYSFNE
jgi:hypothetical protein